MYVHESEVVIRAEAGYGLYRPVKEYAAVNGIRRSKIGSVWMAKTLDKPGVRWGCMYPSPNGEKLSFYVRGKRPDLEEWAKDFVDTQLDPGLLVYPKAVAYLEVFAVLDDAAALVFSAFNPVQDVVSKAERRSKIIRAAFVSDIQIGQKNKARVLVILYQPRWYNTTPGYWKLELRPLGGKSGIKRLDKKNRVFSPFELCFAFCRKLEDLLTGYYPLEKPARWAGNRVTMIHKPLAKLEKAALSLVDLGIPTNRWSESLALVTGRLKSASMKRVLTRVRKTLVDEGLVRVASGAKHEPKRFRLTYKGCLAVWWSVHPSLRGNGLFSKGLAPQDAIVAGRFH